MPEMVGTTLLAWIFICDCPSLSSKVGSKFKILRWTLEALFHGAVSDNLDGPCLLDHEQLLQSGFADVSP